MYGLWYGSDGHLRLPRCRRAGSAAFSNGLKTSSDPIINGGHILHPTLMWFCKTKQKSTASRPACTRTSGNTQQYTNTSTVQYIHNTQIHPQSTNPEFHPQSTERTERGRENKERERRGTWSPNPDQLAHWRWTAALRGDRWRTADAGRIHGGRAEGGRFHRHERCRPQQELHPPPLRRCAAPSFSSPPASSGRGHRI